MFGDEEELSRNVMESRAKNLCRANGVCSSNQTNHQSGRIDRSANGSTRSIGHKGKGQCKIIFPGKSQRGGGGGMAGHGRGPRRRISTIGKQAGARVVR